jgi:hypothetical protein
MRDLDALAFGDLPDGLARLGDDVTAVEAEGDGVRVFAVRCNDVTISPSAS